MDRENDHDLTWDDSFMLARRLMAEHPDIDLETVSLGMIYELVINLPEFGDEPELVNDAILMAIYREWYEEASSL